MKRGGYLKRTTRLSSVSKVRGRAAGRESLPRAAWRVLKEQLWHRAGGYCEVVLGVRCDRIGVDLHHVIKRSRGGADTLDNLVLLCRRHHRQIDAPFSVGRLIVQPIAFCAFRFAVETKANKWA